MFDRRKINDRQRFKQELTFTVRNISGWVCGSHLKKTEGQKTGSEIQKWSQEGEAGRQERHNLVTLESVVIGEGKISKGFK